MSLERSKKLVFYSGGPTNKNHALHRALVEMASVAGKTKSLSMTYIPFCRDGAGTFFKRAQRRYRAFGIQNFHLLYADEKPTPQSRKILKDSNIVYLAGGNTFQFLNDLRASGWIQQLKAYSRKGGVLAGLSAGALILTENINLAAYPPFDSDENDVKLKDFTALGLVPFEFYPHFLPRDPWIRALKVYSKAKKNPILAATDGSGIVVQGKKITFFGEIYIFTQGGYLRLH